MVHTGQLDSLLGKRVSTYTHEYTERDLSLYALGVGCSTSTDLQYVYENHRSFNALPTFAIVVAHPVCYTVPMEEFIPKYDMVCRVPGANKHKLFGPSYSTNTLLGM